MRPNDRSRNVLFPSRLSAAAAPHSLLRRQSRQAVCVLNQQLRFACGDDRRAVQIAVADRIIFQMDQTAPANQNVLRHESERRQNSNLDRGFRLPARRHRETTARPSAVALHNPTDSERLDSRKHTTGKAVFAIRLQYPKHPFS